MLGETITRISKQSMKTTSYFTGGYSNIRTKQSFSPPLFFNVHIFSSDVFFVVIQPSIPFIQISCYSFLPLGEAIQTYIQNYPSLSFPFLPLPFMLGFCLQNFFLFYYLSHPILYINFLFSFPSFTRGFSNRRTKGELAVQRQRLLLNNLNILGLCFAGQIKVSDVRHRYTDENKTHYSARTTLLTLNHMD